MHNGFARALKRFGPDSKYEPVRISDARMYCSTLARTTYENFSVATVLLPRKLVPHFHAIYAYCRWADDLADETGGGTRALHLLRWWREELERCYAGDPRHPVMVALWPTVQRFAIPRDPFLNLLFAFEQDQIVKRYKSFEQLLGYCKNSANPVGRLVLYLCEAFDEKTASLSDQICTALQLANFWQDVARDLDIDRIYLPGEDRARFGVSDAALLARQYSPSFAALLRFEVDRARDMFYRGMPLVDLVPPGVRMDIELFLQGGLAILRKIERCHYNVLARRPTLDKFEKASLIGGVLWRRLHAYLH